MARPRECTHADRYADGHCKICTRQRRNAWRAKRLADERYWKQMEEFGIRRRLERHGDLL